MGTNNWCVLLADENSAQSLVCIFTGNKHPLCCRFSNRFISYLCLKRGFQLQISHIMMNFTFLSTETSSVVYSFFLTGLLPARYISDNVKSCRKMIWTKISSYYYSDLCDKIWGNIRVYNIQITGDIAILSCFFLRKLLLFHSNKFIKLKKSKIIEINIMLKTNIW